MIFPMIGYKEWIRAAKSSLTRRLWRMGFVSSFIGYAVKAAIFAAVALAGIVLGKKFRDKKDSQKTN